MTAIHRQNGELFVGCKEREFYVNCTKDTSKVQYTQTPHNISQYLRQELWCRFSYSFRLSRAKAPELETTGGTLSSIRVYIL